MIDSQDTSMIFERDVEDPLSPTTTNTNNYTSSSPLSLSRQQSNTSIYSNMNNNNANAASNNNLVNSTTHHNLENLIPPALDASCSIITDENTNLNDVDLIYSRRPSTIGLDMALGNRYFKDSHQFSNSNSSSSANLYRSQSHSIASPSSPHLYLSRTYSNTNNNNNNNPSRVASPTDPHHKLLRFYSYADMLSDEMTDSSSSGPSPSTHRQSHSLASPVAGKQFNTFNNPFIKNKSLSPNSSTPHPSAAFQFDNSNSDSTSTTDDENDMENDEDNRTLDPTNLSTLNSLLQHPRPNIPSNSSKPRLLRARSSSNANMNPNSGYTSLRSSGLTPLFRARTYSSTSGLSPSQTPVMSRSRRSPSQYFIYNEDTLAPLQTDNLGEVLRKKMSRTATDTPTIDGALN
ncbi:hypothetical protein Kpol_1039p6 [Vanderwaltozyma polyspora DSM 70294]|uniref:Uncharacterized protein n=1 Tax=Vanderwaltozyma polyspora (strain ATCC 22028 / DSM 70294 / BCRC 21397 / CBS 2163 / NBRC 10782 / NRRL Y-8283 / UCD 57-17) TaxID=436907 RepID=A7THD3_VANPO|nr:uncharacterized protein Kpol_1039p6 [Vanderwaltozyma polyspora DSM 70294]EDO18257.1 hypothetical protein Kpol_1039p6 [Vanderwaltozyma polyspora DSM 70294]